MVERFFRVVITPDEEGFFVAECVDLPGCVSQGKSEKEAIDNVRDAINGYLESLKKHGEPLPPMRDRHYVELNVNV